MDKAVELLVAWAKPKVAALGASLSVERLPGRTPLILIDAPGAKNDDTALLYGHLDKQPEMTGWTEGKGPWIPVLEGDKLYGRGGADDGYAHVWVAGGALGAEEPEHPACAGGHCDRGVGRISARRICRSTWRRSPIASVRRRWSCAWIAGAATTSGSWLTTSLRGLVGGALRVEVLSEGVHSGDASGVVPSSFRILRQLLARLENIETGEVIVKELHGDIPAERIDQAKVAAKALGDQVYAKFPFVKGMRPADDDLVELVLNRTWRPALSVVGLEGAPAAGRCRQRAAAIHGARSCRCACRRR